MIVLYSGTPGSGKSLDCAKDIYLKLKLGQTVFGNMLIKPEILKNCKGKYIYIDSYLMNPEEFIEYAKRYHKKGKEAQATIVIDECQQIFNAREWSSPHMKEWNKFFQVHRHYGYNIYLITQYDRLIDRQTRALIEYERVHRKVSNLGIVGWFAGLLFKGGLFVCVEKYYSMHLKTGSYYFRYKKKYGEFYDSYSAFSKENTDRNDLKVLLETTDMEDFVEDEEFDELKNS